MKVIGNSAGLSVGISEGLKPAQKPCHVGLGLLRRPAAEEADERHRLLLGMRRNRPRQPTTDQPKKFPPLHCPSAPLRSAAS